MPVKSMFHVTWMIRSKYAILFLTLAHTIVRQATPSPTSLSIPFTQTANDVNITLTGSPASSNSATTSINASAYTSSPETCLQVINRSNGIYNKITESPTAKTTCQLHMHSCRNLSDHATIHNCMAEIFRITSEACSDTEQKYRNTSGDACLDYLIESEKQGILLNETAIRCSPCGWHYVRSWSFDANVAYWRCGIYIKRLHSSKETASRASLAICPCSQFLDFSQAELQDLCVTMVNETIHEGRLLTIELINSSVCAQVYVKTLSFITNIQYWKCQLYMKTLRRSNTGVNNLFLLNTVCKPFVSLTASDRALLLVQCYTFINKTLQGNVTFLNHTHLNRTSVDSSPCAHIYVTTWSLEMNNLYWQCNLLDRSRRNANASTKLIRYEMRRSPCRIFLVLTAAELDEECVDALRRTKLPRLKITAELLNQTICARAYRSNLTFARNVLWWTCLTWVEDKQKAGVKLKPTDLFNSVCKTFMVNPPRSTSRPLPRSAEVLAYIVNVFVIITGTIGNGLVIYVLIFRQRKLRPGDAFTASLAVTDFASSIFTPIATLKLVIDRSTFDWGLAACKLLHSLRATFTHASSWTLVAIAAERARAIVFPFKKQLACRTIVLSSGAIYMCSLIFSAPKAYHQTLYRHPLNYTICSEVYPNKKAMLLVRLFLAATTLLLPFAITTALYSLSIANLVKQRRVYKANRERTGSEIDQISEQVRLRRDLKVTRMFITVVAAFFILVTPYWILSTAIAVMQMYDESAFFRQYRLLNQFNYFLPSVYCLNSCINPFIYSGLHPEVRYSADQLRRYLGRRIQALGRFSSANPERAAQTDNHHIRKQHAKGKAAEEVQNHYRNTTQPTDEAELSVPGNPFQRRNYSPHSDTRSTRGLILSEGSASPMMGKRRILEEFPLAYVATIRTLNSQQMQGYTNPGFDKHPYN